MANKFEPRPRKNNENSPHQSSVRQKKEERPDYYPVIIEPANQENSVNGALWKAPDKRLEEISREEIIQLSLHDKNIMLRQYLFDYDYNVNALSKEKIQDLVPVPKFQLQSEILPALTGVQRKIKQLETQKQEYADNLAKLQKKVDNTNPFQTINPALKDIYKKSKQDFALVMVKLWQYQKWEEILTEWYESLRAENPRKQKK